MALKDDIETIAAEFMTTQAKNEFADVGRHYTMMEAHMMACALSTAISMKRVAVVLEDISILLQPSGNFDPAHPDKGDFGEINPLDTDENIGSTAEEEDNA